MLAKRLNSTKSSAKDMSLTILPELKHGLSMLQKNYQSLILLDKLIMHLTLLELAY